MRLLTPAIKYWVCKSAPGFLYEAMECLGGNGYVEEGILARHYREVAGQCDLGRLGQCDVPRRAAGVVARGRCGGGGFAGACRGNQRLVGRGGGRGVRSARRSAGRTASAWRGWRSRRLALLAAAAALNRSRRIMPNYSRRTRLAGNHASMYGAVDLASDDIRGLLERALP